MRYPYPHLAYRQIRSDQLLAQIMHIIGPYLKPDAGRDLTRELGDLLWQRGAYVVTDADRAAAGLQPRDHNGLTLDELQIIEAKVLERIAHPVFIGLDLAAPSADREVKWPIK